MSKKEIKHLDVTGKQIFVGDLVASSSGGYTHPNSRLKVGKVERLTPKRIFVDCNNDWLDQICETRVTTLILKGETVKDLKHLENE